MPSPAASPTANLVFLALKGLATVAELAIAAAILYAATMAARYWSGIGV